LKLRIFILIIGISFLQISILFAQECYTLSIEECADYWYCNLEGDVCTDNEWSLFINSTNQDIGTNEGNDQFHIGILMATMFGKS